MDGTRNSNAPRLKGWWEGPQGIPCGGWEKQGAVLRGMPVLVHHREWVYLANWLGLREAGSLEPQPGVPPTPGHLAELLQRLKAEPARAVIHSPYNDARAAAFIAQRAGIPAVLLPYTVGGSDRAKDLFGLYVGTPLTERADYHMVLPDRILVFQGPHERAFAPGDLDIEIRRTVAHEVAHFFGISDERLEALGLAFQIVDDILNLRGFRGELKSRGEDIAHGKVTLPVAKALSRLSLERRRALWSLLQRKTTDQGEIDAAIDELEACGALAACEDDARRLVEDAWSRLEPLVEDSLPKLMLRSFGWYVLERHY